MSVIHRVPLHVRVFLLAFFPVVILAGCATVPVKTCEQVPCLTLAACSSKGADALETGRPDEASCYFTRAVVLSPQDSQSRLLLGSSLLVLGKTKEAADSFRWVVDHDADEERRLVAREWLSAIDSPLSIAIFFLPDKTRYGVPCGFGRERAGSVAARLLRKKLSRFGAFRVREQSEPVESVGDEFCARATTLGARVAIAIQVSCHDLQQEIRNLLGLTAVRLDKSTLSVSIEVYQVSSCKPRSYREKTATAAHILPGDAIHFAIDRAVSQQVLAMATDLLVSGP